MIAFLGIDLGTTGCKAAVYSIAGELISLQYIEIPLITIDRQRIEQDPEDWTNLTWQVIKWAVTEAKNKDCEIVSISISSQGISFVPVDIHGKVLRNAITWLDSRADQEIQEIATSFSPEMVFKKTGKRIEAYYTLPKIIWLRKYEPRVFAKTHSFLTAHDYVLSRLSGEFYTEYTLAGGTMMLDLESFTWWDEIVKYAGIQKYQLPQINWSGTQCGTLRKDVATELGLDPNVAVIIGCQDQKCAANGAGLANGIATVSLGTASAITALSDHFIYDQLRRIPMFPYIKPNAWVLEGVLGTSGAGLKWFRNTILPNQGYDSLDFLASQSSPGSNGSKFYPHLSGASSPHWNPNGSGTFSGIHLATSLSDLTRSVLEGIAYQIRSNLEVVSEFISIKSLILFGGGAKSRLWADIICQVTNLPVYTSHIPEMANWGACLLAAKGVGYEDELRSSYNSNELIPQPDQEKAVRYNELFHQYREIEKKILA